MATSQIAEDIIVDEVGTPDPRRWLGSVQALGKDISTIRELAKLKLIRIYELAEKIEIRANDKVGILILPSGRRIRLETKIPGIRVLEWLAYVEGWPEFEDWTRNAGIDLGAKFPDTLMKLFIRELDLITRVHLRKGFQQINIESSRVCGRIRMSDLGQKPWRLPRLPQSVRDRTYDTDANIVLALAIDEIVSHQQELPEMDRHRLNQMREFWANISRKASDLISIVNTSLASPPLGYRRALQLARLILLGASLDPKRGVGGSIFTISLAKIWERGVERMFIELQEETGWRVIPADKRIRHWDDSFKVPDSNRFMIADLILEKGTARWVLDAKYKCDFGDESRNDRFQICAYALAFEARRVSLVYPSAPVGKVTNCLLNFSPFSTQLSVMSHGLRIEDGPSACVDQLRKVVANLEEINPRC